MDRQRLIFLVILITAALARLIVLSLRSGELSTDPDAYLAHAEMLSAGHGFASPATQRPTAFRPPGYPLLIALIPGSANFPERSVAMLNLAAGILTVLLTKQLAEQLGLRPAAALAAAAMTAADPLLLRYTSLPMTEVLSAALLTAALLLFIRYRQSGGADAARGVSPRTPPESGAPESCAPELPVLLTTGKSTVAVWWNGAAAGLLLGLAALVRPVALVVAAFLVGWLMLYRRRLLLPDKTQETRLTVAHRGTAFLMLTAIPCLTLLLTISPWIVRNAIRFHHLIPATTHGGYTLALGNNPEYYRDVLQSGASRAWEGVALVNWQQRMNLAAQQAGVFPGDEVATDAWMYQQARSAIREDPVSFLRACIGRIASFWALTPAFESRLPVAATWCVGLWYFLIWAGVTAALWAASTGRTRTCTAELWLSILGFMLLHTFYWTDARMRAPLMPALYVLCCIGTTAIFEKRKGNRTRLSTG